MSPTAATQEIDIAPPLPLPSASSSSSSSSSLDGLYGLCVAPSSSSHSHRLHVQPIPPRNLHSSPLCFRSESAENFQLLNLLPLKKLWDQRPFWLKMHYPSCHGDKHVVERIANVLTSVPFIVLGLQAPRKKVATKLFADSVVGVGLASGFYHSSHGDARKFFRWGDYAMIATSSLLLSRALKKSNDTSPLYIASAAILPIQPLLVSALHVGLMEVTFAQRAQAEPQLRRTYAMHAVSSLIGCALFVAEDVFPETPYLHAAWHIAAAMGTATCLKLLE